MRYLPILLTALVFVACNTSPDTRGKSQGARPAEESASTSQQASIDTVAQFLLDAAAADFHAHQPPEPVRFREVRLGHSTARNGQKQYILCGQFLPAQEANGKSEWTPFVTIKTSGYEQWLGGQATTFCRDSSVIWDTAGDLSSSLQSRLDSLRQGAK